MSILTQLLRGKITWATAETQIEAWGSKILTSIGGTATATATVGEVVSDLKQAASNAISLADSLAGPIIATGADAVSAAFTAAAAAYLGPFGTIASPAAHDAIDQVAAGLKAEIDAAATALKASLSTPPSASASSQSTIPTS